MQDADIIEEAPEVFEFDEIDEPEEDEGDELIVADEEETDVEE